MLPQEEEGGALRVLRGRLLPLIAGNHRLGVENGRPLPGPRRAIAHFRRSSPSSSDGSPPFTPKYSPINAAVEDMADRSPKRIPSSNFFSERSEEHTSELQSRLHLVCR